MKQTVKLYDSHPYETDFEATILSVEPNKKGWKIVLNQTLFFPEEGGQSADDGWIGHWQVTDVQIQDGIIYHMVSVLENNVTPEPGMQIIGRINWQKRFSNMQNHTGEHILSGLIHAKYGFENVGFHLSDNIVTFDQSGYLTLEQLRGIELEANRIIWANLPVTALYVSPEEAKTKTYRSKIEIEGDVRLVTIGEADAPVDVCACCAPHVARTGEIGLIKILRSEKYKGGTRLTILCGERALVEVVKQQEQIEKISHLLRAKQEEASEAVSHLFEENAAQKERLNRMQEEKIRRLAKEAHPETETTGDNIWIFTEDLDLLPHRNLVNLLTERTEGYAGVFQPVSDTEYRFIIGSHTEDCREIVTLLREHFGSKGGGKPEMVQGSVCAGKDALLALLC